MPILEAEANVYPDALLDAPTLDAPTLDALPEEYAGRRWWAIYTLARQEKALARHLLSYEIPFYLPLVSKSNLIRGRRVDSHLPLFQGYVFLYGSDDERVQSLTTNRISRILPVPDQQQMFDDLCNLKQLIELDAPVTVESRLSAGRRVRIKSGVMKGLEGIVESRRGRKRLSVCVRFLQQSVSVELDDFLVEPMD